MTWRLDWFPTSGLLKKNCFLRCCYSLPVDRSKLEHRTIAKLPEIMVIYNDFTGNWKILRTLVATWLDGTRPSWCREHMAVQRNQRENDDLVVSTPLKNDGVKVSWDDEIPNGKIKAVHVPNHQWFFVELLVFGCTFWNMLGFSPHGECLSTYPCLSQTSVNLYSYTR